MSAEDILKRTTPEKILDALNRLEKDEIAESVELLGTLSPKALERQELAMLNLVVLSTSTGLGGRTVLQLGPDAALKSADHVWNPCFKVGDIVKVEEQPKKTKNGASNGSSSNGSTDAAVTELESSRAVVSKVGHESLSVVAEDDSLDSLVHGRLWLTKLSDPAVFKRMRWAIEKVKNGEGLGPVAQLMRGQISAQVCFDHDAAENSLSSQVLNETQKSAVGYAVGSNVSVIHGPPGTGKTSTLVEIVCQLVAKGERVLVCGPSNVSVDNLVERLAERLPMPNGTHELLRLGHPARLSPAVLRHSFDLLSKSGDEARVLRELQAEINATLGVALRNRHGSRDGAKGKSKTEAKLSRGDAFKLLKDLRKDYRSREGKLMYSMLKSAKVVAATLHGAGSKDLGSVTPMFSTIIIDEVSQALLPQCWIPAVIDREATRLIIAGDNKQLPPTIKSNSAMSTQILETTLFDALIAAQNESIKHMITIQYRMCSEIMEFPSVHMYDGKLLAHESVASQRLANLDAVEASALTQTPILWIDTMNGGFPEVREEDALSTKNPGEADKVIEYIRTLQAAGLKSTDIGVIAPYNAQVALIRSLLSEANYDVEVSTVDGFQGREKEVIILSMVRSNDQLGNVGFVSDSRRINVAITRPKRHLCVVGNSEMLGSGKKVDSILPKWVNWCMDNVDIEYAE